MIASYRKPSIAAMIPGAGLLCLLVASGWTDVGPEIQVGPAAVEISPKSGSGEQSAPGKTITVAGTCRDEGGKPLSGVRVVIYREDFYNLKTDRLRELATEADGKFRFADLPSISREGERDEYYVLVVTAKGRASSFRRLAAGETTDQLKIPMPPSAILQGRVTDPAGKPIAGAMVWINQLLEPIEGVLSARTDADGHYAVTDLSAWDCTKQQPTPTGDGSSIVCAGCYFSVRHPDFGQQMLLYKRVPDTINITLHPAGIIEGRVVDKITGKPAAGVTVWLQGTHGSESAGGGQTRTGPDGRYRFPSLVAAKYNAWAQAPDRACVALDSFVVEAGKTHQAPDLFLVDGGWIEGNLVDAETGRPISRDPQSGQRLQIGLYGPSRPKSGAACQGCTVDDQGGFRLQVAPGLNFPYIMFSHIWDRTQRREFYLKGIEVQSGEVVRLTFRILPKQPPRDPDPAPVRLTVPVPDERAAATAIRRLEGWYRVDKENHVMEVNMVYHETPQNVRHDNDRTDTDEALRTVGAFPRLKELYLHKGQATDEGLKTLANLKDLKILFLWDANQVTDAGTKHLLNLENLEKLHINNSGIGDPSLKIFSKLSRLVHLSLQGNAISDEGLKQLAELEQLKALWVGMSLRPITDAGAATLAGLTDLEELDLQGSQLSDAGVAALKPLKRLRALYINGGPKAAGKEITDASVETLLGFTKLQHLGIQNTAITEAGLKRLIRLPALKELWVSSRSIPESQRDQLKRLRAELKLNLSRSAGE